MVDLVDTLPLGHTGRLIGKYRLERKLGQGAMGEVFLGVHTQLGNAVAVKILSARGGAEPQGVERFLNEARAVAAIDHENIARVIDQDRLPDGTPYIVMEYVEGRTLRELLHERGQLELRLVAQLGLDVLSALAAAHALGIVHRDLKPENLLVTPGGRAKVLDFGIAKLLNAPVPLTQEGALIGTPHYMAPEQAMGSAVDGRTDLYALGVMLYECVTGQRPFDGPTLVVVLQRQLEAAPLAPSSLRPDSGGALEVVLLRALQKDPQARFSSAQDMAEALRAAIGEPLGSWHSPPRMELPVLAATPAHAFVPRALALPATKGTPRALALVALAALIAVALLVAVWFRPVTTTTSPPTSNATALPAPAVSPDLGQVPGVPPPVEPPAAALETPTAVPPKVLVRTPVRRVQAPTLPAGAVVVQGTPGAVLRPDTGLARGGRVSLPLDFDPTRFDPYGYLPRAQALARERMDDAVLIDFSVDGVFADGHADLTLAPGYDVDYFFRSPSRSRDDPRVPDADEELPCLTYVVVSAKEVAVFTTDSFRGCKEPERPRITCPLARAARAAIAQGGSATSVATASWLGDGHWFFSYGDEVPSLTVKCP
jgi:predicted Ser/Thr protein kinase